jgi:hypothetical protein
VCPDKAATVSSPTDITFCASESFTTTIQAQTDTTHESYSWFFNGQELLSTDSAITVSDPGVYELVVNFKDGCQGYSDDQVTIERLEVPTVSLSTTTIDSINYTLEIVGSRDSVANIRWFSGNTIVARNSYLFQTNSSGNYYAVFETPNGCTVSLEDQFVPVNVVGLPDYNLKPTDYKLYPNPASDRITIQLSNSMNDNFSYKIYNLEGRMVKEGQVKVIDQKIEIDLIDLVKGLYQVHFEVSGKFRVIKLLKE